MTTVDIKLKAAKMTLDGERIRWLIGKQEKLTEEQNVFGEQLAKNRYQYILWKAALTEYKRNLILSNLETGRSVHELHDITGIPKPEIVENIIALLKWRKIEQVGMEGRSPKYKAVDSENDEDEGRGEN
ncbi:MAG TPA: hypothetical protein ENN25_03090 [Euryarchaeota archaeon]|nr:hypothetical protein [Euryarchaeota archaeon]